MSSKDINLVSQTGFTPKKDKRLNGLRRVAIVLICLVGLVSIFAFILNLASPLNSIKKQQDLALASINAKQQTAVKIAIINERVSSISKIYKDRPDFTQVLNLVLSKVTSDMTTSGLNIDESSVTVTLSSPSLLPLNNFLNSLIDSAKKSDEIKSVSLDSLSVSDSSLSYLMSVKIQLK